MTHSSASLPTVSADGHPLTAAQIEQNFADLHPCLTDLQAMAESNRCLYCYDAPCIQACPTSIDIPGFIRRISTGNPDGAARTILSSNILGGTCARVCPTEVLCQQSCVRNRAEDTPVEIGRLQRYAVDHFMAGRGRPDGGVHPFVRAAETGRRVAVVGAGPAGLSCAHALAVAGHTVTIFEAKPKPGGLNEYGLAAYKMTDDFARTEVDFVLAVGGITIEYGQSLGEALTLDALRRDFDAVFLGIGLGGTNGLGLDGEDKVGVVDAIDFIAGLRQAEDLSTYCQASSVVVIGGGNTAIDAAVQAKRLGADDVTLVYRRGPQQMGATPYEQDLAATNGVTVRHWAKPVAIRGNGHVEGMVFERTRLDNGTLTDTGRRFEVSADLVLKAIGQTLDSAVLTGALAGLTFRGGKIVVDETGQTALPGVYAGGDCIASGQDLTVQAVEDGKRAARAIHSALMATNTGEA